LPAVLAAPLAILLLAVLPALAFAAGPAERAAPVAGVDYVVIEDGQRHGPADGRIEVVEVFSYGCHHCANFEPMLAAWKHKQRKDVRLDYLPLPYSANDPLAAAFFAAQSDGSLPRTHPATFRAIHRDHTLPRNPTADEVTTFYAGLGVDAARLKAAMTAPATLARLPAAREFAIRAGVEGTPTLIVNGRYRIIGKSLDDVLRIADHLIARERAVQQRAASRR
jgi:thiol:disulfide interchange protein DsbA